jgi:AraC-like DNA-binding protein
MSVSSFHEHFKSVTSMSPLHYQKVLRLQEARRLMLSTMMDAGSAVITWDISVPRSSAGSTADSLAAPQPKMLPACGKTRDYGPELPHLPAIATEGPKRQILVAFGDGSSL